MKSWLSQFTYRDGFWLLIGYVLHRYLGQVVEKWLSTVLGIGGID